MGRLGIVISSLLSGVKYDHVGNEYPIPQTMAGVEMDVDSDEYQAWYINHLPIFRRRQFLKLNTRSVRYS